ncbi:MAG: hypothetical protein DI582_11170 [Azospirillum brasilense]|nr:MAG: hypothetical protein DI582_11170 [Azospirillum brasilense]
MTDLATLQTRLAQAEEAHHQLMMGEKEVTVSVGGYGSTTYAQTSIDKLEQYIERLKAQISRTQGKPRRSIIRTEF